MKLVVKMTTETALLLGCKFSKPCGLLFANHPVYEFPKNSFFIPIQNQPFYWPIDEKLLCEYH